MGSGHAQVEVSDRMRGTSVGGIRLAHELANSVGLAREIDARVNVLKQHLPYHESDHVLAMAFNLLGGGSCIEDLEHRRNDEALLDLLSAERIPDPTTAGDFCRRFDSKESIDRLQGVINECRLRVWQRQPKSFFDHAFVDADGTIAETTGSCKEGMDLSYKRTWGYQALHTSRWPTRRRYCSRTCDRRRAARTRVPRIDSTRRSCFCAARASARSRCEATRTSA